ncbi:MAG: hypothetical protein M3253_02160 [Chloroflexota bacterium]|nr:hypothetical protein [Chloroflexota bacterium]
MRVRPFLAPLAVVIFTAACTAAPGPSPSPEVPSPTPELTPAATATPAPATPAPTPTAAAPTPTAAAPTPAQPTPTAGGPASPPAFTITPDADLEATLPNEVGGLTLDKRSLRLDQLQGFGGDLFPNFAQNLGVSPTEVSLATAVGSSPENEFVIAMAIRVPGATPDQLLTALGQAIEAEEEDPVEVTQGMVAGKQVFIGRSPDSDDETYFYASGDVVFLVSGSPTTLAEEALAQLP